MATSETLLQNAFLLLSLKENVIFAEIIINLRTPDKEENFRCDAGLAQLSSPSDFHHWEGYPQVTSLSTVAECGQITLAFPPEYRQGL